jgi:hypothetical protein
MPKKTKATRKRSPKAGRPPEGDRPLPARVSRRRKTATVSVKKKTTMLQTDAGTKVLWGANQRRPTKT